MESSDYIVKLHFWEYYKLAVVGRWLLLRGDHSIILPSCWQSQYVAYYSALSLSSLFFFFSANSAAFAAGILFFLTYFPFFFLSGDRYEDMSQGEKMAACLLSNVAMAFGINTIMIYEGTGNINE